VEVPHRTPDTHESLLIDRAGAALRRGLVDDALATLMQHERLYPHGALAEERAVLVIEAYLAQGNATLAHRRIEAYRRDFPAGFLRARVDRAEAALTGR
jgi:outer membrane protein assembly factor BamD (BamD/ComL family)